MLKKTEKLIITFYTSAEAMAVEKTCKDNNINGKLISAPRELSADCGIAYMANIEYEEIMKKLLSEKSIEYEKMVKILY